MVEGIVIGVAAMVSLFHIVLPVVARLLVTHASNG
jgi:hypothetical protein